mmetsp:Transcript_86764/g.242043  ORF Transcript_86764/g.242043 Transcript_86764/m.242043 type:complete len:320 (-) Transcript_86764:90-1049(-)
MQASRHQDDGPHEGFHRLLGHGPVLLFSRLDVVLQAVLRDFGDDVQLAVGGVRPRLPLRILRVVEQLHEDLLGPRSGKLLAPQLGVGWLLEGALELLQHLDLPLELHQRHLVAVPLRLVRLDRHHLLRFGVEALPADARGALAHESVLCHEHGVPLHHRQVSAGVQRRPLPGNHLGLRRRRGLDSGVVGGGLRGLLLALASLHQLAGDARVLCRAIADPRDELRVVHEPVGVDVGRPEQLADGRGRKQLRVQAAERIDHLRFVDDPIPVHVQHCERRRQPLWQRAVGAHLRGRLLAARRRQLRGRRDGSAGALVGWPLC